MTDPSSGRAADPGKLSSQDAGRLTEGIAGLAGAGLPLPSGLRALGEELSAGPLRRMLDTLAGMIESGMPLEAAIESQGGRFPGPLRGLVLVGARSGTLGQVLGRYIGYHEVGAELRRRTWLSLAYPILAITASLLLFVYVSYLLVNDLAPLFADFGLEVNALTRFVMQASGLVAGNWWHPLRLLMILATTWIVLCMALPTATRRSLAGYIPVLGWVWRWTSLSEFCHLLGLLLESNIPLAQAVQLAGEGVQDDSLDAACRRAAHELKSGRSLSSAIGRSSIFPAGLSRLLHWAEGNQALAATLHMAGEMYGARARAQALFAGTFYGVVAVLVVLLGIGLFLIAVVFPIVSLISKLSG